MRLRLAILPLGFRPLNCAILGPACQRVCGSNNALKPFVMLNVFKADCFWEVMQKALKARRGVTCVFSKTYADVVWVYVVHHQPSQSHNVNGDNMNGRAGIAVDQRLANLAAFADCVVVGLTARLDFVVAGVAVGEACDDCEAVGHCLDAGDNVKAVHFRNSVCVVADHNNHVRQFVKEYFH